MRVLAVAHAPFLLPDDSAILVGQASTPAAGLRTRSRFMFAACRYAEREIFQQLALGAAYTPASIGVDGKIYSQTDGHLFVVGQ